MNFEIISVDDAYDKVWETLKNLSQQGVKFTAFPSRSREIESTLKKYGNKIGRIEPSKWVHIEFECTSPETSKLISKAASELGSAGIGFDTGGGCGIRDWEIDWSLQILSNKEAAEAEKNRKIVSGIADNLNSEEET